MLDEEFDDYDMVVMLDPDMFVRKGMDNNILTDVTGIGMHNDVQTRVFNGLRRKHPSLMDPKYPFWGGAIYRLTRDQRQRLRKNIREDEIICFGRKQWEGEDEGIMHRLATLAQMEISYIPGWEWCHCSYRDGVERSSMIHVRTKVTAAGPKRTKIENYRDLVERGLIEE
ncbi:hypothetical protein [Neptunomonas sp.]|uniref:hypothetical protein n=1 Tax=Neptunomonas sp. TaxID=1971898 RepID=UPI0035622F66